MKPNPMPKVIIKSFEIDSKAIDEEKRVIPGTASVGIIDREDDVIDAAGIDISNFSKNPVMLYAHNYAGLPIAKVIETSVADNSLKFKAEFAEASLNPFAEQVFQMFRQGFLRAFSIGFRPLEYESREKGKAGTHYKRIELLEISACPVPANPEALAEVRALSIERAEITEIHDKIDQLVALFEKEEEAKAQADPAPESGLDPETKPGFEETENEIRYRVRNPGDFEEDSFRRIALQRKKRVEAIIGRLKGRESTSIQALRFPKEEGWTIPDARKWVEEHKDSLKSLDLLIPFDLLSEIDDLKNSIEAAAKKETKPEASPAPSPSAGTKEPSHSEPKKIVLTKLSKEEIQRLVAEGFDQAKQREQGKF